MHDIWIAINRLCDGCGYSGRRVQGNVWQALISFRFRDLCVFFHVFIEFSSSLYKPLKFLELRQMFWENFSNYIETILEFRV